MLEVFMEFNFPRTSTAHLFLDTPYRDGVRCIKTAFQKNPTALKVDASVGQIPQQQQKTAKVSLKERGLKLLVGVSLCIPVINIAIDFALRHLQIKPKVTSEVRVKKQTDFAHARSLLSSAPEKKMRKQWMASVTPELEKTMTLLGFDPKKVTFKYTFLPDEYGTDVVIRINADQKEFQISTRYDERKIEDSITWLKGQLICDHLKRNDPQTHRWQNKKRSDDLEVGDNINLLKKSAESDELSVFLKEELIPETLRLLKNLGYPQATLTYTHESHGFRGYPPFTEENFINFSLCLTPTSTPKNIKIGFLHNEKTGDTNLNYNIVMEKLLGSVL